MSVKGLNFVWPFACITNSSEVGLNSGEAKQGHVLPVFARGRQKMLTVNLILHFCQVRECPQASSSLQSVLHCCFVYVVLPSARPVHSALVLSLRGWFCVSVAGSSVAVGIVFDPLGGLYVYCSYSLLKVKRTLTWIIKAPGRGWFFSFTEPDIPTGLACLSER